MARAKRRKARSAAAKSGEKPLQSAVRGMQILEKAIEGGYTPNNPPKRFTGKGSYNIARSRLRGKGDFVDDLVSGGGKLIGNGIRSGLSWLTNKAGSLLGGLLGQGDYLTGGAPVGNSHVMGAMPTVIGNKNDPAFVMEFVEEIASVTATDVFKSTTYHIQPGLSSFLKWLPKIARSFEQYELEAMIVIYKPTIAPLNDAASGDLVLSVVYDVNGTVPQDITTALNSYLAVGGRPLDQMMMAVECDPKQTQTRLKFVRATDAPEDADHNLYDWGIICLSQEGQPTSSVGDALGRLYVSYKFRFYKPLVQLDLNDIPTAHYWVASTPSTAPFGATAADFVRRSDNTFELTWVDEDTFAFPSYISEGKWLVMVFVQGFTAGVPIPGSLALSGAGALNVFGSSASTPGASGVAKAPVDSSGAANTKLLTAVTINVTAKAPTISIGSQVWAGNGGVDVLVSALDVDLVGLRARREAFFRSSKQREELRIATMRAEFAQVKQIRSELDALKRRLCDDEEKFSDIGSLAPVVLPDQSQKNRRLVLSTGTGLLYDVSTGEPVSGVIVDEGLKGPPRLRDPSPAR